MISNQNILAIIPARAGSKGLPGKNIKSLCGKPLIAWTIEAAIKSKYIDKVIVSTDSENIANISKKYGAKVPFLRPDCLATDDSKSINVIKHAISFFKDEYEVIIYLQPTSPLRTSDDIDDAIAELNINDTKAIISVCEVEHPVQWTGRLPDNLCMKNFIKNKYRNKNRQELERFYRLNGAIYISDIEYFKNQSSFLGNQTYAYKMSQEKSIDIDSIVDFKLAEILLRSQTNG